MPGVLDRISGQDIADQQNIPVAFRWYDNLLIGDPDQPGQWSPFQQTAEGGLFVSIVGGGGLPILLPDNDDDVPVTADDDRLPTVARLFALDWQTGSDYDRIRTDTDDVLASEDEGLPALKVMGRNRVYNEFDGQWYLERGQDSETIAASAARTVTTTFGNFVNSNWRAAHFILDVTAGAGIDIEFELQARNQTTAGFYPLLTSAAIVATGVIVFKIGIGFTPVANLTANDLLPYIFRVVMTHNNANAVTYSISANYSV